MRKSVNTFLCLLGVVILSGMASLSLSGCQPARIPVAIGLLPDEDEQVIRQRFQPVLDYLSANTRGDYSLVLPQSYDALVTQFGRHQVQLGYFGGVTFLHAHTRYQARPMVMRKVDTEFTSVVIVRTDSGFSDLVDLQDQAFAFGSTKSTSGHLMPRYFMQEQVGIDAAEFFSDLSFTGTHDRTALMVQSGEVAAGAVNEPVYHKMIADGRLDPSQVKILWRTPPFANYVWAADSRLSPILLEELTQAFLQLDPSNPEHKRVLDALGDTQFLEANIEDFKGLKKVMEERDLLQ